MSKVLIGNIKGPKGEPGPEGPQGPEGKQGPVGLVNADASIEFDDYSAEGSEVPAAEEALAEIVSGKSLKSLLSNIKAFLMGGGSTAPEVIGDKFSETTDYVAGDYAIKDNVLYHFIADKVAGEWDETAVEPTTVTKELQDVNANFQDATNSVRETLVAVGLELPPENLTIIEMMEYAKDNIFLKAQQSAMTLRASGSTWVWCKAGAYAKMPITQASISGTAFTYSGNSVVVNFPVKVTISASIRSMINDSKAYAVAEIRINNVSKARNSKHSVGDGNVSTSSSLNLNTGDVITLYFQAVAEVAAYLSSSLSVTGIKI